MTFASDPDAERFHNYFRVFVVTLKLLASDAVTQCEKMGPNVAWELKRDASDGYELLASKVDALSPQQREAIRTFLTKIEAIPEEALGSTRPKDDCITTMQHPVWAPLRVRAGELLVALEPARRVSEDYFRSQTGR